MRSKLAVHLHAQSGVSDASSIPVVSNAIEKLGLNGTSSHKADDDYPQPEVEPNGTTPYTIKDVRTFKSMLQISAGPQPVKHISEFEELDSKL